MVFDLIIHWGVLYHLENWEQDLSAFVKTSELLFSNTNGLTLFINGVNITNITNYNKLINIRLESFCKKNKHENTYVNYYDT